MSERVDYRDGSSRNRVTINGVGVPDGDAYYDRIKDESSLVAYWPLTEPVGSDKRVVDTHGGRVGAISGDTVTTSGAVPYGSDAMSFDGTGDFITVPQSTDLDPSSISIECWIRRTVSGSPRIIAGTTEDTNTGWQIRVGGTDLLAILCGNGSALVQANATGAISQDEWIHYVATITNGAVKQYVNGVLNASAALTYVQNTVDDMFIAAADSSGSSSWAGEIAHLAVYNELLTDTQINSHYSAYAHAVNKLAPVGYWRLNEPSGTAAADLGSSDEDGTYVNTPTLGQPGGIAEDPAPSTLFTAASSEDVDIAFNAAHHTATTTVCAWLKTSGNPTTGTIWNGDVASAKSLMMDIAGGPLRVYAWAPTSTTSSTSINDDEWHFCVGQYDGADIVNFVDGVEEHRNTGDFVPGTVQPVRIGERNGNVYMDGKIQEVAVFDKVLTAGEILDLYEIGKQTFTNTYDKQVLALDPVAYWPLDEASGTTAVDKTGNGKDLTYTGSPTLGVAGGVVNGGTCVTLDGTTQYAVDGAFDADLNTADFTLIAWFKSGGLSGTINPLVSTFEIDTNYFGHHLSISSASIVRCGTGNGDAAAISTADASGTPLDDGWHMAVGTYDSATTTLTTYLDSASGSPNTSASYGPNDANNLHVGRYAHSAQYHDGEIQGVAVFDRALSADEIAYLYSLGKTGK